jgi:dTDP-4-dehydrorhamnose 3,5-epimerase
MFARKGMNSIFLQQNQCRSKANVLRGLHYQLLSSQVKLVRVSQGSIFDVAVDLRKSSPTFGRWHSEILSEENRRMLWIPEGFAHGYYVFNEGTEVQYSCSKIYDPDDQHAIIWNDPKIGIEWPAPCLKGPMLSPKDANAKMLADAEVFD